MCIMVIDAKKEIILLIILVLFSFLQSWRYYFISDDGFISLRYAWNFAQGLGLVWEENSREFGYSNFLYTFLAGILFSLGFGKDDALLVGNLITIPCYIGSMLCTYWLCLKLTKDRILSAAAACCLILNGTFSAFSTGLLETSMQTLCVLLTFAFGLCFVRESGWKYAFATGISATLGLLTRIDTALLLVACYLGMALVLFNNRKTIPLSNYTRYGWAIIGIPVLVGIGFFLECYAAYDQFFPTPFYAKQPDTWVEYVPYGVAYFADYLKLSVYLPCIFAGICLLAAFLSHPIKLSTPFWVFLTAVALWCIFLLYAGGDFIDYRMLVPVMPLFIVACFLLLASANRKIAYVACAFLMVLSEYSSYHKAQFTIAHHGVNPIAAIHKNQTAGPVNRQIIGATLGKFFNKKSADDVIIAVTAAGAIPFYSGLRTIDMHGLNTKEVLNHTMKSDNPLAGHQRIANFHYLARTPATFIISAHQWVCDSHQPRPYHYHYFKLPVLLIPVDKNCSAIAYYLHPHPDVETLLAKGELRLWRGPAGYKATNQVY
jgi:arabinofuranosyltransferase